MTTQLSDPGVEVNDVRVGIVPNSVEFDEGMGEQKVVAESAGDGVVTQVFSNNVETNLGEFSFELRATLPNIALARTWKANGNQNVVVITGKTPEGSLTRTYQQVAIVNNYKVPPTADGVIKLQWKGNQPSAS